MFVHEEFEDCMFAKGCERKLMYKHEEREDDEDEIENESDMDEEENKNQKAVENRGNKGSTGKSNHQLEAQQNPNFGLKATTVFAYSSTILPKINEI